MRHRVRFCANRSNRCGNMAVFDFQDVGRPPSWIYYSPVWTNHEVYFGGLCHCEKFGLNWCSSFDNMKFLIFSAQNAYSRPFLAVFGAKMGENRNFVYVYPSRNATHPEITHFEV